MSEIDDMLEEIRQRRYKNMEVSRAGLDSIEGRTLDDLGWTLYYVDMLRAKLQRCKDGHIELTVKDFVGFTRRNAPAFNVPVLPPPPPPITFKPDIVERPGAPYGKREW